MYPILIRFEPSMLAPEARIYVMVDAPISRESARYMKSVERWLLARLRPWLESTNAAQLRAMEHDLVAMTRGALLKVALGELDAPFEITEEMAHSLPITVEP